MINDLSLYSKLQMLTSEDLRKELLFFIEYLLNKQFSEKVIPKRVPRFGCARGTFRIGADFDAPLDDFKDYV